MTLRSSSNNLTPNYLSQTLFILRNADLQLTTDQPFVKQFTGTNYLITNVVALRKTGGASVACTGGIYTAASKAGSALIGAAQSWLGVSGANKIQTATLAALIATDIQSATPILSLSVGSTAAVTGDIFIQGICVD